MSDNTIGPSHSAPQSPPITDDQSPVVTRFKEDVQTLQQARADGSIKDLLEATKDVKKDVKSLKAFGYSVDNIKALLTQSNLSSAGRNVASNLQADVTATDPLVKGALNNAYRQWRVTNGAHDNEATRQAFIAQLAPALKSAGVTEEQLQQILSEAKVKRHPTYPTRA